jgi:replication-associated recombination protein RarA
MKWEQKYRPAALDQYVWPSVAVRDSIHAMIASGDLNNLMLYGTAGTGKTSLVEVICTALKVNTINYKKINGSLYTGKNDILPVIEGFLNSYYGWMDGYDKAVIFIDEADRLSAASQDALKSLIEDRARTARFVFTCNDFGKIEPALASRLLCIEIGNHHPALIEARAIDILTQERIRYDRKILQQHLEGVKDLRQLCICLQNRVRAGVLV